MTVKLIRMWSGEDVITDIVEETNDSYVIENPIVAVPSPQEGRIAFVADQEINLLACLTEIMVECEFK